jgi:hypothetical protein
MIEVRGNGMRADDPRLIESKKRLFERVAKYDERMITVLKNHLAAEQSLNDLLKAASRRWKGRSFAGKIDVAKGLFLPELSEDLWAVLKVGNDLRNAVAHGDKEGTVAARMTDLRKAFLASVTPEQRKGVEEMTDMQMVMSAFNHCGSHLMVAAESKRAAGATK